MYKHNLLVVMHMPISQMLSLPGSGGWVVSGLKPPYKDIVPCPNTWNPK